MWINRENEKEHKPKLYSKGYDKVTHSTHNNKEPWPHSKNSNNEPLQNIFHYHFILFLFRSVPPLSMPIVENWKPYCSSEKKYFKKLLITRLRLSAEFKQTS